MEKDPQNMYILPKKNCDVTKQAKRAWTINLISFNYAI